MPIRSNLFSLGLFRLGKPTVCSPRPLNLKSLVEYLQNQPITWHKTGDPEYRYQTETPFGPVKIKIGDFPEEPIYLVVRQISNEVEQTVFASDELLSNWSKSSLTPAQNITLSSPL